MVIKIFPDIPLEKVREMARRVCQGTAKPNSFEQVRISYAAFVRIKKHYRTDLNAAAKLSLDSVRIAF